MKRGQRAGEQGQRPRRHHDGPGQHRDLHGGRGERRDRGANGGEARGVDDRGTTTTSRANVSTLPRARAVGGIGCVRQKARSSDGRSACTITTVAATVITHVTASNSVDSAVPNAPLKAPPTPTGWTRSAHSTSAARLNSRPTMAAARGGIDAGRSAPGRRRSPAANAEAQSRGGVHRRTPAVAATSVDLVSATKTSRSDIGLVSMVASGNAWRHAASAAGDAANRRIVRRGRRP